MYPNPILCLIAVLALPVYAAEVVSEGRQGVKTDAEFAKRSILSEPLSQAWISSGSCVYKWVHTPDFIQLEKYICAAYSYRPEESSPELSRRSSVLSGQINGIGYLDTAMLAAASGDALKERECYREAKKDPELAGNPFPDYFIAVSFLKEGNAEEARRAYESALAASSAHPILRFPVRFNYSLALFETKRVEDALAIWGDASLSDYPMERAWGLEELILYDVFSQDEAGVNKAVEELAILIPQLRNDKDSRFEQNRLKRVKETYEKALRARGGDPLSQLSLDGEAVDYAFKMEDVDRARELMVPWVARYPIEAYREWGGLSHEERRDIIDCHLDYYVTFCMKAEHATAEAGFRTVAQTLPEGEMDDRLVDAYCWWGYAILGQNERLLEAKAAYDKGFEIDARKAAEKGRRFEFLQPRIGGATKDFLRVSYLDNYRIILEALNKPSEPGEGE